jgi:predicted site-specific integrase-resolvase
MIRHPHCPLSIGSFASALVSIRQSARVVPHPGGHRRFFPSQLQELLGVAKTRSSVGYARVSSHNQKTDLVAQSRRLASHCDYVIEDLGSGLNCKKPGLGALSLPW